MRQSPLASAHMSSTLLEMDFEPGTRTRPHTPVGWDGWPGAMLGVSVRLGGISAT